MLGIKEPEIFWPPDGRPYRLSGHESALAELQQALAIAGGALHKSNGLDV